MPSLLRSRRDVLDLALHNLSRRHKVSAAALGRHIAHLTSTSPDAVILAISRLRRGFAAERPSVWWAPIARALNIDLAHFEPSPSLRADLERRGYHIGFIPVTANLPYDSLIQPD